MNAHRKNQTRTGGVYIAVLGSALIIALLGLCALVGQRVQNRLVSSSTDIRQAQLNATAGVELALLTMKQDTNWRSNNPNGNWFTNRSTGNGTCTVSVVDPNDGSLTNNGDDPVLITGIGYSGQAEQRISVAVDPKKNPLSCLRSAIAVGNNISVSSNILRANGMTTANQVSAASAQVYGKVEATSISGSTYNSTTTQITSDKRPTMPDWTTVFNYYKTNGAQLDITRLTNALPNVGQNIGIESGTTGWTGSPTGIATSSIGQTGSFKHGGGQSLRVQSRSDYTAGAAQYIDSFLKPNTQYLVEGYVYINFLPSILKNFRWTLYVKPTNGSVQSMNGGDFVALGGSWKYVSATFTTPNWTGNLDYAFVKIAGSDILNTADFYFDDFSIKETTSGKFMYHTVLGPGQNPFGNTLNAEGVYWLNCGNNKIIIDRMRIVGTLLLVNPGPGSCITYSPISWKPYVAGYPALLVDSDTPTTADFGIYATNRALSEKEDGVNYNPAGVPHDEFGTDNDQTDIYRSNIHGLIAIRHDLTYQNRSLIRGQVIVGNNITSSAGELEIDYQPDSLLNPPPGFWSYIYPRRINSTQKVVLP